MPLKNIPYQGRSLVSEFKIRNKLSFNYLKKRNPSNKLAGYHILRHMFVKSYIILYKLALNRQSFKTKSNFNELWSNVLQDTVICGHVILCLKYKNNKFKEITHSVSFWNQLIVIGITQIYCPRWLSVWWKQYIFHLSQNIKLYSVNNQKEILADIFVTPYWYTVLPY